MGGDLFKLARLPNRTLSVVIFDSSTVVGAAGDDSDAPKYGNEDLRPRDNDRLAARTTDETDADAGALDGSGSNEMLVSDVQKGGAALDLRGFTGDSDREDKPNCPERRRERKLVGGGGVTRPSALLVN